MDVEIMDKKDNPLLDRTEVQFQISHEGEKTPQRSAVRDKIAAATGAKTNAVVVTRMRSQFGRPLTVGAAKVYKSADAARATERPYLLKRNALWQDEKGEASEPTEEEAPPPPPPSKKESKPSEKDEADAKESKGDDKDDDEESKGDAKESKGDAKESKDDDKDDDKKSKGDAKESKGADKKSKDDDKKSKDDDKKSKDDAKKSGDEKDED